MSSFQCCRCNGPVGVVLEVRDPETAKMFTCRESNWHGSWYVKDNPRPPLHVICDICESSLRVQVERDILAEVLSYIETKNQRLEVYTRAPTQLVHQAFEIVDRLKRDKVIFND